MDPSRKRKFGIIIGLIVLTLICNRVEGAEDCKSANGPFDEASAKQYLVYYNEVLSKAKSEAARKKYLFMTDIKNPEKEKATEEASLQLARLSKLEQTCNISKFDHNKFQDPELKRIFRMLKHRGAEILQEEETKQYYNLIKAMTKVQSIAKVCPFSKQECDLEKEGVTLEDITRIMTTQADEKELAYYWTAYRDATGRKIRSQYLQYLELARKIAKLNGFTTYRDLLIAPYESETFPQDLEKVYQTVRERLYVPLFAYVRFKLRHKKYPQIIKETGPLPAHLMGTMYASSWEPLLRYLAPYPDAPSFNITGTLKNITSPCGPSMRDKAVVMFDYANDFFVKTGLHSVEDAYGPQSDIVKPTDGRVIVCHASAFDFSNAVDFRIKMCTEITQKHFNTIHHELGHIQYYKQYKDLPSYYRTGANPGFHEAIGDVISLSVRSVTHLLKLGFLKEKPSKESIVNHLMLEAFHKITFLPYAYVMDSFRWKVFSGEIPEDKLMYHWIKMRAEFQGVVPPSKRSEKDFDPAAKYHVPAAVPYIRYFFSYILQYQLLRKLCQAAGHTGPLHECDYYESKEAGKLLSDIMRRGASQPWPQILKETTGEDTLRPDAIIEYFQPILDFLKGEQTKYGYPTHVDFKVEDYYSENDTSSPSPASKECDT